MRKFAVVTTFHEKGLHQYAQKMIDTFCVMWPEEVTLHIYPELCNPAIRNHNHVTLKRLEELDDLMKFKERWRNVPKANGDVSGDPVRSLRKDAGKGFKWDAVRFAHKVYAIFHCAKETDADVLFWMDADMICHSPITMDEINQLVPEDRDLCFLGREGKFSECGLYAMNLHSPHLRQFLENFQRFYDDAENGIFTLEEWHDSFVFDAVRQTVPLLELDWSKGLIKGEGHPLINSRWGAYLDHLKGARKKTGRSLQTDLRVNRTEQYWMENQQ
ncbi:MAG: hypothetical protein RLZZ196_116 [Bacteroidota bacterium]|jgi:hypothetical protein